MEKAKIILERNSIKVRAPKLNLGAGGVIRTHEPARGADLEFQPG